MTESIRPLLLGGIGQNARNGAVWRVVTLWRYYGQPGTTGYEMERAASKHRERITRSRDGTSAASGEQAPAKQSGTESTDTFQTVAETVRAGWSGAPYARVVEGTDEKYDAFAAADAALAASGTVALELAVAGLPMAVTYRVNPVSAAIARRLIRVPHVAMVNLLARREVVPELLQQDCTPEKLCRTVLDLLAGGAAAQAQRAAFGEVLATLRPAEGRPSDAAAREVLNVLDQAGGDREAA